MAKAQFDRQEIIDKATQLFWQRGYQATSMQNLSKVTGLKPGSIYLAFGSKEGMFNESLASYSEQGKARLAKAIETANSIEEGIRSILIRMVDETTEKDYCSCFLVKSQLELADTSQPLYQKAVDYLADTEALFYSYLIQIMPAELAKERTTSLMIHIYGIRVYGYQTSDKQQIISGLKVGLSWLNWDDEQ